MPGSSNKAQVPAQLVGSSCYLYLALELFKDITTVSFQHHGPWPFMGIEPIQQTQKYAVQPQQLLRYSKPQTSVAAQNEKYQL
jgi:hypothetical protein